MKKALLALAVAITAVLALNLAPRDTMPDHGAGTEIDRTAIATPPYQ